MEHLFVYDGLLDPELKREMGIFPVDGFHAFARGHVGSACINERLYPVLIDGNDKVYGQLVSGRVLNIGEGQMEKLDAVLGAVYERIKIKLMNDEGMTHRIPEAWSYAGKNHGPGKVIEPDSHCKLFLLE